MSRGTTDVPGCKKTYARRIVADTKELLQKEAKHYGKKSVVYKALEKGARKIALAHGLDYDRIKPKRYDLRETFDEVEDLTFAQFKKLIGGSVFPPKKRFILRYGGAQRDLQIIGEPDDAAARGKFVQLRPVGVLHGERDKLMPMKVAYKSFMMLYRGITPAVIQEVALRRW